MAPNPRRIEARLRELYAQVPDVPCTGACHGACCFVDASDHERRRIERVSGRELRTVDAFKEADSPAMIGAAGALGDTRTGQDGTLLARYRCSMLTADGRCSIYDDRPMICRLFGAAVGIECHKGCTPKDGLLPFEDGMRLMRDALRVGGGTPEHPDAVRELTEVLADTTMAEDLRRIMTERRAANNAIINRRR